MPLLAPLGHLGLEGTHTPAPRAPSPWVLSAQQSADAHRGARWPTCPPPPRLEGVYTPITQCITMWGAARGHDAPGCTKKRGAAPPEVPQDCRVAGRLGDFPVFSLPDLLAPPSPPLQGLEGQAMETIALAEDEVRQCIQQCWVAWLELELHLTNRIYYPPAPSLEPRAGFHRGQSLAQGWGLLVWRQSTNRAPEGGGDRRGLSLADLPQATRPTPPTRWAGTGDDALPLMMLARGSSRGPNGGACPPRSGPSGMGVFKWWEGDRVHPIPPVSLRSIGGGRAKGGGGPQSPCPRGCIRCSNEEAGHAGDNPSIRGCRTGPRPELA